MLAAPLPSIMSVTAKTTRSPAKSAGKAKPPTRLQLLETAVAK